MALIFIVPECNMVTVFDDTVATALLSITYVYAPVEFEVGGVIENVPFCRYV